MDKCSCDRFARLEGASASGYAKMFLQAVEKNQADVELRCRVCGRGWRRQANEIKIGGRESLIRIDE